MNEEINQKETHKTVPIQSTITKIGKGYPDKLVIFKTNASKYWQIRFFNKKKIIKKSTRTENKKEAIEKAKELYEEVLINKYSSKSINDFSFNKFSKMLIDEQEVLINTNQRNKKLNINDSQILKSDMISFFDNINIKEIDYKMINEYIKKISTKNISEATIKKHLILIHKILKIALRERVIDFIPLFPQIKVKDSPRSWINLDEYKLLLKTTKDLINKNTKVRYHQITNEFRYLITFKVNTFLRPSDIKNLKHRNIEIIDNEDLYLKIHTDTSKTINYAVVSMKNAVYIYKNLLKYHHDNNNPCEKDDFVFFPKIKNRDFALQTMRRIFDYILNESNLKYTSNNNVRTLYSLRHTSLMLRVLLGENIDVMTLARNARTSVDMLERFYLKPLDAEKNIKMIQSIRKKQK